MKLLTLFPSLVLLSFMSFGQSLSMEVIGSSGSYFEATNGNLHWTVGEIMTERFENDQILTQGFHQNLDILTSAFEPEKNILHSFQVLVMYKIKCVGPLEFPWRPAKPFGDIWTDIPHRRIRV